MSALIEIIHDDTYSITIINGIRYADSIFTSMAFSPVGSYMRIEARADGTITLRKFSPELEERFSSAAGLPKIAA